MIRVSRLGQALGLRSGDVTGRIKLLAVCLLILDFLLLGANGMYHLVNDPGQKGVLTDLFGWEKWYGELDGSVIELAGHVKLLVASVMLFAAARRAGQRLYVVWGIVLMVVMLDDYLQLHEHAGALLTEWTGPWNVLGLGSQSMGELIFWLIAASLLGLWLLRAHFAADPSARRDSLLIFASMLLLASFAVGLDALVSILGEDLGDIGYQLLNYLETAGELVCMSLILIAVALVLVHQSHRATVASRR